MFKGISRKSKNKADTCQDLRIMRASHTLAFKDSKHGDFKILQDFFKSAHATWNYNK